MSDFNVSWSNLAGFNLLRSSVWIIPGLDNKHSEGIKIQLYRRVDSRYWSRVIS